VTVNHTVWYDVSSECLIPKGLQFDHVSIDDLTAGVELPGAICSVEVTGSFNLADWRKDSEDSYTDELREGLGDWLTPEPHKRKADPFKYKQSYTDKLQAQVDNWLEPEPFSNGSHTRILQMKVNHWLGKSTSLELAKEILEDATKEAFNNHFDWFTTDLSHLAGS